MGMTILNETIQLDRPAREVFAYVADFSTCEQWDATATSAQRRDSGPLGVGSSFDVTCALPVGSVDLVYEILEYEPDQKVVLQGRGRFFNVEDTITVKPTKTGSELDYTAKFDWKGPLKAIAGSFQSGMERMGRASVQKGLKEALDNDYPPPADSGKLGWFTRRGYRQGRKRWNPVSTWMGDKHVVLTGATAGLGLACAEELAALGAQLTLVVRNAAKGEALLKRLKQDSGNENIALEIADLSLMNDVDDLVTRLNKRKQAIDILINNAGALFNPRRVTSEGFEESFALLLLSPYRLTIGLLPLLKSANSARVINVVSGGMYTQKVRVRDLQNERGKYSGAVAYARCKRALMIVTEQWAEEWAKDGIVVNAMHPGWADTPGVETSLPGFHKLTRPFLRTPAEGADTITWLAAAAEAGEISGKLLLDRVPRPTHVLSSTKETAADRENLAQELRAML